MPRSRPYRWTISATSASCTAAVRAIRSSGTPPAWRRPPGPLGQGIGNSVGMAMAAAWLAARYNRPGFPLFDSRVYAMCSDGDLMEGVGSEAASLAGHLRLPNLCWIYDDNHITIEGNTALAFSEDVTARFAAYGWNVERVGDINDLDAVRAALAAFRQTADRPTLIVVRSVIAWGAPHKQNTHGAHGAPLGEDEIRATKAVYGWPPDAHFLVPEEVRSHFRAGVAARGEKLRTAWERQFTAYRKAHPQAAEELELMWRARVAQGLGCRRRPLSRRRQGDGQPRLLGQSAQPVGRAGAVAPGRFGRSGPLHAHLARRPGRRRLPARQLRRTQSSTSASASTPWARSSTAWPSAGCAPTAPPSSSSATTCGRPCAWPPSWACPCSMSSPTIRSAWARTARPTSRSSNWPPCGRFPNLLVMRPGDANEVAAAYRAALGQTRQPAALVLSRQNLPTLDRARYAAAAGTARGGYVLADSPDGPPQVILIGTGSELALCVAAYEQLAAEGVRARVVSLPCWELFDAQPDEYRREVLPPGVTARVAVELGIEQGWEKYLGPRGRFLGMCGFGASAPVGVLLKHFGFTVEHVVALAKQAMAPGGSA